MRCLRVSVQAGLTADGAWRASRAQLRWLRQKELRRSELQRRVQGRSRASHVRHTAAEKNRLRFHFREQIEQGKLEISGRLLRTNDFGAQKNILLLGSFGPN